MKMSFWKEEQSSFIKKIRFLSFVLILFSCSIDEKVLTEEVYNGPFSEMYDVETMMTDSFKMVVKIMAPLKQNYENGNEEYPKGINLEFYRGQKKISTYQSNKAIFFQNKDLWHATGNVVVKNLENEDKLNTEELYWNMKSREFYTDKFITIVSDGEIHTGIGLTANEDFSSYVILKPTGTIILDEEE